MTLSIVLSLGSNIHPETSLPGAVKELRCEFGQVTCSSVIETISEGSAGPNFLNAAAAFQTTLSLEDLKFGYLRNLESALGRIRTTDKNSPRTIDLDISIMNDVPMDPNIWTRIYLAVPLSELHPGSIDPNSGRTLFEIATELKKRAFWKARPDIDLNLLS